MFHVFRSRKRTLRILMVVILAPIIITMVVTLIPGIGTTSMSSSGDAVLAEVGGESITTREVQDFVQQQMRNNRMPPEALRFLGPQAVRTMVADVALEQEAQRLGLSVTDEELASLLRLNYPFLFPDGVFLGKQAYETQVMNQFQMTVPEFESLLRKRLLETKLSRLVADGIVIPPAQLEAAYRREREKAKIEYVAISPAELVSKLSLTPAELQDYFARNRASYSLPERRTIQYMVIDDAQLVAGIQLTQADIERYYNQHKEDYRVQDRARVTHILFKTEGKSPDEVKKIEAKANDVLKQVKEGKDFATLAKANSEDTGSAVKGGEIGWITRGQTVPEFEQKAFSMKPGEVSDLVKTQYGFHIIKVLERETAHLRPLNEVEPEIRQELNREKLEALRPAAAEKARAAAAKNPQDLERAGKEAGFPVFTAKLVERAGSLPEFGAEAGIMDSLFAAPKGSVVGPIQTATRTLIAVVTEIAAPRPAEFSEVADKVKQAATAAKAREQALKLANELSAKARAQNNDLKKAAKEMKLEVKDTDYFARDGSAAGVGSASLVLDAFTAPMNSILGPITAGNNQVVYRPIDRQPANMDGFASQKKTLEDAALQRRQTEAFELFKDQLVNRLQKQGKVKFYQDRIDRYLSRG